MSLTPSKPFKKLSKFYKKHPDFTRVILNDRFKRSAKKMSKTFINSKKKREKIVSNSSNCLALKKSQFKNFKPRFQTFARFLQIKRN